MAWTYQLPTKDPSEDLDYYHDFNEIQDGEAIVSHTVTLSGTTATSHDKSVSGKRVIVWIAGGENNENALITHKITTNNTPPRTYEVTQLLMIRDK